MTTCYRYPNAEKCANCWWNMRSGFKKSVRVDELPAAQRELLLSWLPPGDDWGRRAVCQPCVSILRELESCDEGVAARRLGHQMICAACGDSVLERHGRRARAVDFSRDEDQYLFQQLLKIPLNQMPGKLLSCRTCLMSAKRALEAKRRGERQVEIPESSGNSKIMETENIEPKEDKETPTVKNLRSGQVKKPPEVAPLVEEIMVGGYTKIHKKRAGACVACELPADWRLDLPTRQQLLLRGRLYVSSSARVCAAHRTARGWAGVRAPPCALTGDDIADMVFLLKAQWPLDFEKLENIDPYVLDRWIGMDVAEFERTFRASEALSGRADGRFALAVYLASERTGECAAVLASVTQRARGAVAAAIELARDNVRHASNNEPNRE